MHISRFQKRLWTLTFLLLLGFGLRLNQLQLPNLNIDETWSYINSFYLAYSTEYSPAQILAPEPNNALHLILLSGILRIAPGGFGVRWLSVMLGVLTVALTARIAYHLYGTRAAWIAALVAAAAYTPVTFSQIGRPYMLATMLAALSLLFWVEKRARLNMLASALFPLAHIGAMPVVFVQDVLTLWRLRQGKYVNKLDWIVRRVPAYALFLALVYMTYLRRDIHVVSSGQPVPTPSDVVTHFLSLLSGGRSTADTLILAAGVVLPLAAWGIVRRRFRNLGAPLLWIAVTYGMLIAGTILSDGPIKWIHVTHIAIAAALLIAEMLARAPRLLVAGVLTAFCVSSALGLSVYFTQPDRSWSNTAAEISQFRLGGEPIYLQQPTILWALQVNNPTAAYITLMPPEAERAPEYLYVDMTGWLPAPPPDCAAKPLWSDKSGLRLLRCTHE